MNFALQSCPHNRVITLGEFRVDDSGGDPGCDSQDDSDGRFGGVNHGKGKMGVKWCIMIQPLHTVCCCENNIKIYN